MFENSRAFLAKWQAGTSERQQLQWAYAVVAVVSVVVAGLVSLVDYQSGRNLLKITGVALIAFVANAVVWALLDSLILSKFRTQRTRRK